MPYPLVVDNHGIILSSSIVPISCSVNVPKDKLDSYEIRIFDGNSNGIYRQPVRSNESNALKTSFIWDLKSKSNSYVESGCYTISLIDISSEAKDTRVCSVKCKVIDARKILSTTRSLKFSYALAPNISQTLVSTYFDIIEDIQHVILERLESKRFEEPYFVGCITAGFIQEIFDDIQRQSKSRFLARIEKFQSKLPVSKQATRLGLWGIFDFLINYMSDLEDHARANAMARCGQHHLTQNDKAQIISSLVLAIYPHCNTISFPRNAFGSIAEKVTEGIIKLGIKFTSTKHINRSISICQTLPLENPCDSDP